MALDNQIKLIFPQKHKIIQDFMNILIKVEENKALKSILFLSSINSLIQIFVFKN